MSSQKPISSVFNSAATVGGVLGLVAIFIPFTKEFMLLHPLWGWGLFICTLIVASAANEQIARRREIAVANTMQQKIDSLDLQARQKDVDLIKSRIKDMDRNSDFYVYLTGDLSYDHLPQWFSLTLEQLLRSWEVDKREIKDNSLSEVWRRCLIAAQEYSKAIVHNMKPKERRPDALEISPSLGASQHAEYDRVELKLKNAGKELESALQAVHRATHMG